jgi:hypothetical protein
MNERKYLWFPAPTQLSIQGQCLFYIIKIKIKSKNINLNYFT